MLFGAQFWQCHITCLIHLTRCLFSASHNFHDIRYSIERITAPKWHLPYLYLYSQISLPSSVSFIPVFSNIFKADGTTNCRPNVVRVAHQCNIFLIEPVPVKLSS